MIDKMDRSHKLLGPTRYNRKVLFHNALIVALGKQVVYSTILLISWKKTSNPPEPKNRQKSFTAAEVHRKSKGPDCSKSTTPFASTNSRRRDTALMNSYCLSLSHHSLPNTLASTLLLSLIGSVSERLRQAERNRSL
uniref:(northern house mosquito) hypothetical protein n=1 Tax=Culex pipiens TaxID=7175 RepID=A0A8D8HH55_CULPI